MVGVVHLRKAAGAMTRPGSLLVAVAIVCVFTVANSFVLYLAGWIMIYAISAIGLDWVMGKAGQVSLGNAAFMAVGAYTTAFIAPTAYGFFPVPLLASALLGAVVGLLVGLPALRLKGIYLALATLALHFIISSSVSNYSETASRADGYAVPRLTIVSLTIGYGREYDFVLLVCLLGAVVLVQNMYRAKPGRIWRAVSESEVAASAVGINVGRAKLTAFVGSSALISVSGCLFAYYSQRVGTDTFASLNFAVLFLVMIIVGGRGSMGGAIAGAALITAAPYGVSAIANDLPVTSWLAQNIFYINDGLYGLVVLLCLMFFPGGLASLYASCARAFERWSLAVRGSIARRRAEAGESPMLATAPVQRVLSPPGVPRGSRNGLKSDPSGSPMLEVRGLHVRYGAAGDAVAGIDLVANDGQIVALLGRNGAGKTSVLRAIPGFLPIESGRMAGSVRLAGKEISGCGPLRASRLGIAMVPERQKVLPSLTVEEHLRLVTRGRRARDYDSLAQFDRLRERMHSPAGALSGGERQMLAIAVALAPEPRVLLVDELSLGLAPLIITEILDFIRLECKRRRLTVLLADQNPVGLLAVADHVYVLEGGRVGYSGTSDNLASSAVLRAAYLGESAAVL